MTKNDEHVVFKTQVRVHKLRDEAHLPEYGSEWAACFDLKATLRYGDEVTTYSRYNIKAPRIVAINNSVTLYPDERMLVPTGLVFDLDSGVSMRIHPRSGLALKNGVILANCEGVVDSDYVHQTFIMMHNVSNSEFVINDGDRIAQAEVVPLMQSSFLLVDEAPGAKTSRSGGFGSTGTK